MALYAWRPDLGRVPIRAKVRLPGEDAFRPASVTADGHILARVNPSKARQLGVGEHTAEWLLSYYVAGYELGDEEAPPTEDWDVESTFLVSEEQAELAEDAGWFDANGLPTPLYLREKQLYGLPLADVSGHLMTDASLQVQLEAAVGDLEKILSMTLRRHLVTSFDAPPSDPPTDAEGNPLPVLRESGYDIDPAKFRAPSYGFLRARIGRVHEFRKVAIWSGDRLIGELPKSYYRLSGARDLQLLPGITQGTILTGSIAYPVLSGMYGGSPVPHLIRVEYVAGGNLGQDGRPDMNIVDVLGMMAAQRALIIASDSITAGLSSQNVSIDGLSQGVTTTNSATSATYGANILALDSRIKAWMDKVAPSYRGVGLSVV